MNKNCENINSCYYCNSCNYCNSCYNIPHFNWDIFTEITSITKEQTEAEQPMTDEELIAELERRNLVKQGKIIK